MDLGLSGCSALVGGGSRGIGLAVAQVLAAEGARVALFSRSGEAAAAAARTLTETTGAPAIGFSGDVRKLADLEHAVAATVEAFGGLDVLVCNSGGPPPAQFLSLEDRALEETFEANLLSVVRLVRLAVPHLQRSGRGRVVIISSYVVKQPEAGLAPSNIVRAGLLGLIKTAADELGPQAITINQVCPGRIEGPRVVEIETYKAARAGITLEEQRQRARAIVPMRRYGTPEEVGAFVGFLASRQAGYVTGGTFLVDGGLVRAT